MISASILALGANCASAQEPFDLGEITVFANQTPTEISRTGVAVEVVTADDLTTTGTTQISNYLDILPGISTSSNGGLGKSSSLLIRGLPDRYVAVRINGIDVTDPASVQTQFSWGSLTSAGIGRIEVLKGSQSALFGSGAIGGVINVTSPRAQTDGTTLTWGAEIGSFKTRRADFSVLTKAGRGDLSFSISQLRSDGFSAADENDGNTEADGYDGTTALLSAGYDLTDMVRVGADLIYQNEETNIDAFGGPFGDADRPFFTDRRGMRVYTEIDGGAVEHTLSASYFKTDRLDPLTPFGSPLFTGERRELRYSGTADLGRTTVSFGAEYTQEEALFSNGTADYEIFSLFGEAQYAVSDTVDATASLRHDDNSEFGGATTGRVALAWRAGPGTVVRGSVGTGFRAPSLNELYGPFNFASSNPILEPEESRSAEIGVEHQYGSGAKVQATAFYTEIDNLISYPVNQYEQVPGTSVTKGLELAAELPISDSYSLFGSYTLTDASDANGNQLRRVPDHDILLGVNAAWGSDWRGQITVNHVAGRADDGFPAAPQPDYTVVNASFGYQVNDSAELYLRIENLTNEQYQTSAGYGTSDRAVYFGVRASF